MRNFREDYKKSIEELPKFHMDADCVRDELHHRRFASVKRKKALISAVSAACVLLLCSVGTATAIHFRSSRVSIRENGFAFLGEGAVEEQKMAAGAQEDSDQGQMPMLAMAVAPEETEGSYEALDAWETEENGETEELTEWETEQREYDSIEEFREKEDIVIAIPDLEWLGDPKEIERQNVMVTEDFISTVYVSVEFAGKRYYMSQQDNREHPTYASSSVFMGDAVNERTLQNDQGLEYRIFDSLEDGEITSTHAAISLNGRDLIFSFSGYKKEEIDAVLKQLDVSMYFSDN